MGDLPSHFTHLSTHSHFSLLGATPSVEELVHRAAEEGRQALALTDTNVLYGAVAFRRACHAADIRPIIGMTVAIDIPPGEMYPDTLATWGHLTLLAANSAGYRSLCRLSSTLQSDPRHARGTDPFLTWDELRRESAGLVCLTGDRTGWLERFGRAGNQLAMTRMLSRLGGMFGEQCFVSIRPGMLASGAHELADEMMGLGARFGLRAAAVQPVYCLDSDDVELLTTMAAIRQNCRIESVEPAQMQAFGDETVDLVWPGAQQFSAAYRDYLELLETGAEIAERCSVEDVLPSPGPDKGAATASGMTTYNSQLLTESVEGMQHFFGPDVPAPLWNRLKHEVGVIESVGHADLFLIVADIVRFARSQDIAVSTRGSVANSFVAYCLGISTVDPIAHDLIFERFLNPARRNPPDIDLDFCSRRRDEVLRYVRETYGADHMALVSTMSTLQLRSAVRETAKAYGLPLDDVQALIAMLPRGWHPDPRRRDIKSLDDILASIIDERQAAVLRIAFRLVGRPHHASIHPGGIVITPGILTDIVPVEMAAKGFLITQYTHEDIEAIGLPKIDLLGIRALTVLSDSAELVRATRDENFRLGDIPTDDRATSDLLAAAETIGIFQCESEGARRTLRQLRARSVPDLAVASAFFKPGPATGGMALAFVLRYRGEQAVSYLHPSLEPILGRTKGVMLFQEQVLRVVREIAGLSWEQADHIRRGMSKFKAREMEALATDFMTGCRRQPPQGHGLTPTQAQTLWEQVVAFAGYGFNQGHATAYADVSYRSAYMKAHWPAEFLCARLADAGGFHHQAIYIAESRRLGIAVRPPHVNASDRRFSLSYETDDEHAAARHPVLWMGLGQVRGLQRATINAILAERENQPFAKLEDFLRRVPLQAREIEGLIQCGALDGLGVSRHTMLAQFTHADRAGSLAQLAFAFADQIIEYADSAQQRLQWEMLILGLPVSVTPLDLVPPSPDAIPLRHLPTLVGRSVVVHAYRLPGWSGGKGIFISDGDTFVTARLALAQESRLGRSMVWEPMRLSGRWIIDEWETCWFQVEGVETLT